MADSDSWEIKIYLYIPIWIAVNISPCYRQVLCMRGHSLREYCEYVHFAVLQWAHFTLTSVCVRALPVRHYW